MTETLITTHKWKSLCKAEDCGRTARTAGYCPRHYQQIRRHGRLTPEREYHSRNGTCGAVGCHEPEIAKGYCFRHYQQVRRYGRLTPERERIYGRTTCRVPGCGARHAARGYCKKRIRWYPTWHAANVSGYPPPFPPCWIPCVGRCRFVALWGFNLTPSLRRSYPFLPRTQRAGR